MIIRLMAVDPRARAGSMSDIVVYQVPENSREMELMIELFDAAGIQWTTIPSPTPMKPKRGRPSKS